MLLIYFNFTYVQLYMIWLSQMCVLNFSVQKIPPSIIASFGYDDLRNSYRWQFDNFFIVIAGYMKNFIKLKLDNLTNPIHMVLSPNHIDMGGVIAFFNVGPIYFKEISTMLYLCSVYLFGLQTSLDADSRYLNYQRYCLISGSPGAFFELTFGQPSLFCMKRWTYTI